MPQYHSKKSALLAFERFFCKKIRITPNEEETQSPAENYIQEALCNLLWQKRNTSAGESQRFDFAKEKAFRHLKSIGLCCGIFPISEEVMTAYLVKRRMGLATAELVHNQNGTWGRPGRHAKWEVILGPIPSRD